jgi:DNA-binding transcriptional MerR regulator
MLIQEFCRATGLGRDTVRFYVKRGLLTPAVGSAPKGGVPSNRYQVFDAAHVERARLIRAAQGLGFTLAEIAALAAEYERGALTATQRAEVLRAHLAALDARATHLDALRGYLRAKLRWVETGAHGAPPPFTPAAECITAPNMAQHQTALAAALDPGPATSPRTGAPGSATALRGRRQTGPRSGRR